jgi:hypothetical protein
MRVVNSPLGIDNPREYCALQPWLLASQIFFTENMQEHVSVRHLFPLLLAPLILTLLYMFHMRELREFSVICSITGFLHTSELWWLQLLMLPLRLRPPSWEIVASLSPHLPAVHPMSEQGPPKPGYLFVIYWAHIWYRCFHSYFHHFSLHLNI